MVFCTLAMLPIRRLKALGRVDPEAAHDALDVILSRSSGVDWWEDIWLVLMGVLIILKIIKPDISMIFDVAILVRLRLANRILRT